MSYKPTIYVSHRHYERIQVQNKRARWTKAKEGVAIVITSLVAAVVYGALSTMVYNIDKLAR